LPEELIAVAAELDMPAVAITDRDGVYGAPRFHMAAKKARLKAHIGSEITVIGGRSFPLLARTRTGYQNLCRLVTRMKLRARKGEGEATFDDMAEFAGGLVCLTGEHFEAAEQLARIYGRGNVYVELQRHYQREEEARNQAALAFARRLKLPVLATNGAEYAVPKEREILDVLTCVRNKVTLETAGRLLARNSERHLKPATGMARLFADIPDAIANTVELSSRLEFTLEDLGYEFPKYPVPEGETMASFLRKRVYEGALHRYTRDNKRAWRQIERELGLVEHLHLEGYFLIVWDIVEFCRRNGILAQGRGSAANSAVCYSLGITAVDPVGMELLFERFLSEERGEWPDIDIDLPSGDKRERAIQYVYERYGKLGAAMTANVITYRGRSAAREVGKVLGFDEPAIARLAGLVRTWEWKDPKDTTERQFRDAGLDLTQSRIQKFLELYLAVQDLPRHLGQHSGGMVICQGQLDSVVPLEPATMPGRVVVQWDKDDCADLGLIKVDLLGLGMMAVLEESLVLIREAHGEEVDLAKLPPNDPAVYKALQTADTIGMFQVESRAQMATLPRLVPRCFYDIVVQVGIIRPGPIVGELMHPYLRRRQGREPVDYMHPSLEPVLKRTLGVPLFQEQLLRMAMIVAGFTGGEGEELRRAFSHKRSEQRMREIEVKLRRGMERNGITGKAQDRIVQAITSFALYGFPESHAASFALLAYASAFIKCHYLAAFTAAMLNNWPMGFYHPSTIIKDAQRHGLRVLPVDVQRSAWLCTIEDRAMRLGLKYVRGLRQQTGEAIARERPFESIDDLVRRVPELHKDELATLASVGALNSVGQGHRRDTLWEAARAARPAGPLFEPLTDARGSDREGADSPLARMTDEERVCADFRGTGVTIGRHPMALRREQMNRMGLKRAIDLHHLRNGVRVRVGGSVIVRQRPGTAKGFVFLSLEDETGIANVIVTPDVYEQTRVVLVNEPYLLVEGVLQNFDNVVAVRAQTVAALRAPDTGSVSHDFH
jgi:error-prone DNA polymerase